jgi:hypothetical protein
MKMNSLKLIIRNLLLTAALCCIGTTFVNAQIAALANKGVSQQQSDSIIIDGVSWYIIDKQTISGRDYFYLLRTPKYRPTPTAVTCFGNFTSPTTVLFNSSANNQYNVSNVRQWMLDFFRDLPPNSQIKQWAVVPSLGTITDLTAVTTPTAVYAKDDPAAMNGTKDVLFAPSIKDLRDYNHNHGPNPGVQNMDTYIAITHPLHNSYTATTGGNLGLPLFRQGVYWLRTPVPAPSQNLFGVSVQVSAPGTYGTFSQGEQPNFSSRWAVPGVWVHGGDPVYTISGTISGLPNNSGIPVFYTINGGAQQSVTTDASGNYAISAPSGSNVVITPQAVSGYTVSPSSHTVSSVPIGGQSGLDFTYQQIYFTVNGSNYLDVNGRLFCDKQFTFVAFPNTLPNLRWYVNNVLIPGSNNQSTVNWTAPDDGTYTIRMETSASSNLLETTFKVGMESLIWTPGSVDWYNWHNPNNWTPKMIPTACHDVYIPGNLQYYPNLASAAQCRDIYFMQGGELGRPDRLTYRHAHVQYNFDLKHQPVSQRKIDNKDYFLNSSYSTFNRLEYSAFVSSAPLQRERWYMLSSPLRGVVSGDLCFGGFPLTFMRKFGPISKDGTNYSVGQWTETYTSLVEPVSAGPTDGFAFFMYGYGNPSGENAGCLEFGSYSDPVLRDFEVLAFAGRATDGLNYGLREVNGILELPSFDDETKLHAHRIQTYSELSGRESRFYSFYDHQDPSKSNRLTKDYWEINREPNNGNFRFVVEEHDGSQWIFRNPVEHPGTNLFGSNDFMVGNPYMSAIDMIAFLDDNTYTIEPEYKLWNGTTFISYIKNGPSSFYSVDPGVNPGFIAPLQGFLLKTRSYFGGGSVVKFDVTKVSTVRPNGVSNLRSEVKEENIIRIKAENDKAASYLLIGLKEDAVNDFRPGEDVQKLFTSVNDVPEIYALAGGDIPTDINFINNDRVVIVPLGIRIKTTRAGEIRLTFTGMDNYTQATKIELIDAKENKTIDITGKSDYIYTFNNIESGINNGRFLLRISNSTTGLQTTVADNLKIYGDSEGFYVTTPSADPVQQVLVYDFQGKKIFESTSGASYYPLHTSYINSPLIVKAITKNGAKTVKLNTAVK